MRLLQEDLNQEYRLNVHIDMSFAYFDIGVWESALMHSVLSVISLKYLKILIRCRYWSLCLEGSTNDELKIIHFIDVFLCTVFT